MEWKGKECNEIEHVASFFGSLMSLVRLAIPFFATLSLAIIPNVLSVRFWNWSCNGSQKISVGLVQIDGDFVVLSKERPRGGTGLILVAAF